MPSRAARWWRFAAVQDERRCGGASPSFIALFDGLEGKGTLAIPPPVGEGFSLRISGDTVALEVSRRFLGVGRRWANGMDGRGAGVLGASG